ncbi:hypothetical protein D9613_005033 [Agrocybe pediades]|uniref:Mediator of RNA polymerase II transcription subunit 17 n=1 Tax=Agrocybe pediades TaxID=84607 RepID=A0A8H4QXF9_9AGAR|nr:hypothetical protein D9613_005033 [Agrocybe pediades]
MSEVNHANTENVEPSWKKLKLSLERPYKDDSGNPIPVLLDLTPEGEHVYEPKETATSKIESNLRRIFQERGVDFFEHHSEGRSGKKAKNAENQEGNEDTLLSTVQEDVVPTAMTMEELLVMRTEIMGQLFVAVGEMSQARDLLNSVLAGTPNNQVVAEPSVPLLSSTLVSKPAPIVSVQAFNAQLAIGSKDEALRKAARLFKAEAEIMERNRVKGEKYWVDALRVRRANWRLSPAPLPPGSATGKGADKTSKDFMISYGLETSPTFFRRRAVAQLPTSITSDEKLVLPFHQNTRLRISISTSTGSWSETCSFASPRVSNDSAQPETILKYLQTEVVDQEIFSLLVKEAGSLPTASARVSERLIVIDASQGLDLSFELMDSSSNTGTNRLDSQSGENICELIYHALHVFLLRKHDLHQQALASGPAAKVDSSMMLLQPIIDLLQYRIFCQRVEVELRKASNALVAAGVSSSLRFNAIGERGDVLLSLFSEQKRKVVGGEAIIRIGDWHTLWFSFLSPSTLTAHLSHATLTIASLPQLSQLLMDEIERCLLQRICTIGREICSSLGSIWFIDLNRCVAKWEGCMMFVKPALMLSIISLSLPQELQNNLWTRYAYRL